MAEPKSNAKRNNGGARPGAGRKKGSLVRLTSEIAIKTAAAGIQPIEVILSTMREAWEQAEAAKRRMRKADADGDAERATMEGRSAGASQMMATQMAEAALPYTTPRLAATTVTHKDALGNLSDGDLAALLAFARTVTTAAIAGIGDGSEEEGTRVSH